MPKTQPKLPKYKNFDGKVFTKSIHSYEYKSNAIDSVKNLRKTGHFARKIKYGKRWYIYYKTIPRLRAFKRYRKRVKTETKQKRKVSKQARKQRKIKRKSKGRKWFNMPCKSKQKYRWLKRGSYSNKRTANIVGKRSMSENVHRSGYKINKKGKWYIVYVYTNERGLF